MAVRFTKDADQRLFWELFNGGVSITVAGVTMCGFVRPTHGTAGNGRVWGINDVDVERIDWWAADAETYAGGATIAHEMVQNDWYFVAIVISGSTLTAYLKNVTAGGSMLSATAATSAVQAEAFCIGGSPGFSADSFGGDAQAFRVFDAALTATEIDAEAASITPVHASLWAHWPLADAATATNDTSGNGRHLTASSVAVDDAADLTLAGSDLTLSPSFLTNASTLYAPTVAAQAALALAPSLLTNTSTLHAPTLSSAPLTLAPALLTNTSTLHAPTLSATALTLSPSLLTNTSTVYAPTVAAQSELTVAPALLTNTSSTFAPTFSSGVSLSVAPSLLTNTSTVYAPTVSAAAALTLAPSLLTNTSTLYAPALYDATVPRHQAATATLTSDGLSTATVTATYATTATVAATYAATATLVSSLATATLDASVATVEINNG